MQVCGISGSSVTCVGVQTTSVSALWIRRLDIMVSETLTWLHAVKPLETLSYGSDSQAVASDPTKTINQKKTPQIFTCHSENLHNYNYNVTLMTIVCLFVFYHNMPNCIKGLQHEED